MNNETQREPRICIIGAGMSGMLMGIKLLKAGISNFQIYERASTVGGTWRENRYPGVACDVASFAYCYEFEPNANWSHRFSPGPEIFNYFKNTAEKYQLLPHIKFNTEVSKAEYKNNSWHIESVSNTSSDIGKSQSVSSIVDQQSNKASNEQKTEHAEFDIFIAATGPLTKRKYPDIPGLECFAGDRFHTADWNDQYELAGKRVGVIGTGSSAVQMMDPLSNQAKELKVFQRTAQWIMPTDNIKYTATQKKLKRWFPILGTLTRKFYDSIGELFGAAALKDGWQRRYIDKSVLENLNSVSDPALREKLTPDHLAMCKRMIVSDSYYPAMQRNNVDVLIDNIIRVEPTGVVVNDGSEKGRLVEVDTLITATGFYPNAWGIDTVIGENGESLAAAWDRGVRTYRSVTMPGFPNYFMLIGPNSPITNLSLIDIADIGVNYAMQCINKFRKGELVSITPKEDVTAEFTDSLVNAFDGTRWVSGCNSWYLEVDGVPVTWPWAPSRYRKELKKINFDHYDVKVAWLDEEWLLNQKVFAPLFLHSL